jgi:hypothetical protein
VCRHSDCSKDAGSPYAFNDVPSLHHRGRLLYASIPRVAGGARERDRVADVGEAGDVGEGALEAEAEAGGGTVP